MGFGRRFNLPKNIRLVDGDKAIIDNNQPLEKEKKKRARDEEILQEQVATYIKIKYPDIIFTSESSGIRVPMSIAKQMKKCRSGKDLPDLIILEPRKGYHGCCIELKKETAEIYKKDGSLRKNEHVEGQEEILLNLKEKGYFTSFAIGFDHAISLIDFYLGE